MANETKHRFLEQLTARCGALRRLGRSLSLYELAGGAGRVYIRYSKVHGGSKTFYGLRHEDLQQLEGRPSIVCFLWPGQTEPLLLPFSEYEHVFQSIPPFRDGQYKAHVFLRTEGRQLYIEKAGRFNIEAHFGWHNLETLVRSPADAVVPQLSHPQVQTLLGSIGASKGYDVWIPLNDRDRLDWALSSPFGCRGCLPERFAAVAKVLQQVDVIWIGKGSTQLRALFEVEHSTPIYSGLLRLNDVYLAAPHVHPTFSIVAKDARREVFVQQVSRPTFRASSLSEHCTFHTYVDVFAWHNRVRVK